MSELTVSEPLVGQKDQSKQPPSNPLFRKPESEIAEKTGFSLERSTLDEGPVLLQWPENLSAESVADFEYWIQGVLRRAKRKAGVTSGK